MEIIVDIPKPVFDETIDQFRMPQSISLSRFLEQIWRAGHVFHPACHDNPGFSKRNGLGRHDGRLEAGPTDFVHRRGPNRVWDSGSYGRLPGRSLA